MIVMMTTIMIISRGSRVEPPLGSIEGICRADYGIYDHHDVGGDFFREIFNFCDQLLEIPEMGPSSSSSPSLPLHAPWRVVDRTTRLGWPLTLL